MSDEIERWLPVVGWPEYAVSDLGRIKRVAPKRNSRDRAEPGRIRKPSCTSGYQIVRLTRPGHSEHLFVHRVVMLAFVGPPPMPLMEVNHIDSDRWNPRLSNLEWVTKSQNRKHGYENGFCNAKGSRNGHSKLTEEAVAQIRQAVRAGFRDYLILAERHGVTVATIFDVVARRSWPHVA